MGHGYKVHSATVTQKRPLAALMLRWITQNVSSLWGMRLVRHLPGVFTDFETEVLYQGIKLQVFTGETIGAHLYYRGEYETDQLRAFLSLISSRDLVFDIGANLGIFSLLASNRGARVIALEPSLDIYKRLNMNIQLNEAESKVKAVRTAVSSESSTVVFFEARRENQGVGRIFQIGNTERVQRQYRVRAETLDNLAQEYGTPGLIKLDIEGAEWLALKGARRLMSLKGAPRFFVELHPQEMQHIGGSPEECINLFEKNGYLIYGLSSITSQHDHSWYVFSKEELKSFPMPVTRRAGKCFKIS